MKNALVIAAAIVVAAFVIVGGLAVVGSDSSAAKPAAKEKVLALSIGGDGNGADNSMDPGKADDILKEMLSTCSWSESEGV